MVNKVILLGNVGRDPEVRAMPSGENVATFSLATSRKWKGQDGNRQEETTWHNVTAFGKMADVVGQYVTKGKQLYIEGRIKVSDWEKDGQKHYKTEIIVDQLTLLGSKGDSAGAPRQERSEDPAPQHIEDDDIPF